MSNPRRTRLRSLTARSGKLERQTRSNGGFSDTESSLARSSTNQRQVSHRQSKICYLFSYFGNKNPLPVPILDDDVVWLMDNVAFRGPGGIWNAEFVAAAFDKQPSARVVDLVGDIASMVGLSRGRSEEKTIEQRVAPFVMQALPGRQIKVQFDGLGLLNLGPGGRNGISSDIRRLARAPGTSVARCTAEVPVGVVGLLEMKTVFAEPQGWAIISGMAIPISSLPYSSPTQLMADIDDTIKITQTSDPVGILRSTFVVSSMSPFSYDCRKFGWHSYREQSEPTPVPGMPELYAYIQSAITTSAPFFYLSASPYCLYPFLRTFRDAHYPHGQLILRDANLLTASGLLSSLTLGTEKYKVDRIKKVHHWFPQRKMIVIGDSTQSDPEAYGTWACPCGRPYQNCTSLTASTGSICRMFPGWVGLVLIRKVVDIASVGIEEKNAPERFERAFAGVPR